MAITKPMLPPKAGYVEVVDENGNHVYKPTPETERQLKQRNQIYSIKKAIERELSL